MKSLRDLNTWELIAPPKGRKIIKNRWVYKIKSDGRLKSRLVARGFTQVYGIDFDETWAPVGRKASLKLLIAHVLRNNWKWRQMDVDTAFLNSDLHEEIYMSQPQGFEDGTNRVCKLLKSVYGLKQASREWYHTLREFIESQDLKRSRIDPCIYLADGIIVFIYVDDIILAGSSDLIIDRIAQEFKKRFKMKDMGCPKRILGLDLTEGKNGVHLCGSDKIQELLIKYQMENSRYVSTPMDHNQVYGPNVSGNCSPEVKQNYGSLIGSLLFIANSFRPDISYAASVLSVNFPF
jgi:hypothetical protein